MEDDWRALTVLWTRARGIGEFVGFKDADGTRDGDDVNDADGVKGTESI